MLYHQAHNSVGNYAYNAFFYDNIDYSPHFHKNFELIYVISGQIFCHIDDKSGVLREGEFALCLSDEIHSLISDGDSRCWVGVFSGDHVHAFEKMVDNKTADGIGFTCRPEIKQLLLSYLISETAPPIHLLKACLYAVCHEFEQQMTFRDKTEKRGILMRAMTDFIAQHYRQKIGLSDMAQKLGYNYHYLSKIFHKSFQMSFSEFLNQYRLDAALKMLIETDWDIADLALESGFQSIRSFNDYFKARIGMTPYQYRTREKN